MKHTRQRNSWSLVVVAVVFLLTTIYRAYKLSSNELSWDVFGYYLPLPATFVHGDPMLKDDAWARELLTQHPEISGTLYQVTQAPDGRPMYFFLIGMALLYTPLFLIGHASAAILGHPTDGFSPPYQVVMALGFLLYTLVALVHLRRILLVYFNDRVAAWTIVLITIGTNWFHFMTVKNLETANALFMLMAVLVWNTMEWHRSGRFRNLTWIAVSLAMLTLVKPSEVLAVIIPLLWGVHDRETLQLICVLLGKQRSHIFKAMGIGLLILLPQLTYWWVRTGSPVFDSYKNPGVGLDLWSPHVMDALFSFRKGWLLYTPIMAFALAGFVLLLRRNRELFPAIAGWFAVAFWIICSWSEWWYGASFSVRPMITTYVLLSIPLGLCIESLLRSKAAVRITLFGVQGALVGFNLFQTWQHHKGILDPYRTTKAYYLAILGRTSVPTDAEMLKSVERSFDGRYAFTDPERYRRLNIGRYDFEEPDAEHPDHYVFDTLRRSQVYLMDAGLQFSPSIRNSYTALTDRDHIRVKASVRILLPEDYAGESPCLVFTMERQEGSYGYVTRCLDTSTTRRGEWVEVILETMPPPVRDPSDRLICYVWHRSASPILIDDLDVQVFVPK